MIDKIKAEADAIPCGKDEKIKALEALLKLALKERDEALAMSASLAHSSPSTTWAEDAKKAYKAMIADAQFHKGSVVDDLA